MNVILTVILAVAVFAEAADELRFVTIVHRHGDRSPVGTYPTDPHRNESIWNNGWGELTSGGKKTAYSLGKWLRTKYSKFLPKIYNKNDIQVQSTDVSRTLMSAYLVLAGLYEPTGSDVWDSNIKWQPIPVHTVPTALDNVLAAGKPCPRHTKLLLQLMLSKEITSQLTPLAAGLSDIVQQAGYDSSNVLANFAIATMVYDSLNVQNQNGLELPKWSQKYFPQPLANLSSLMLKVSTYNKPLQRLSCGLLLKDILEHFKSKSMGVLRQKMWQYSAHDVTIVGLRQCLGFNETVSPPYASALIMELWAKNDGFHVKVLYKAGQSVKTLTIPECTELCNLEKFEELVKGVIPEDWESECSV